jgi:hypothetical protein
MFNFQLPQPILKIKVDKAVKPIPYKKRKTVELTIGGSYYVCFGNHNARPCTVTEIISDQGPLSVTVEIPAKPMSKNGYIDSTGKRRFDWKSVHTIFADEIGRTPEEAVLHEVTW